MNDVTQNPPVDNNPPATPPATPPLPNDPAARQPDGTLKEPTATPSPKEPETKESEAKKDEKPTGAPEKYEPFKAPDGVKLDDKLIEAAQPIFKKHNLSQEAAQEFVDLYNTKAQGIAEEATAIYNRTRDDWRAEVLKDPNLSHNGEMKPEVKAAMAKAIDGLGQKEAAAFRDALNITGAGDNPAVVAALYAFAQKFNEGTHVTGKNPVAPNGQGNLRPTAAQSMYPNLPSAS